MTATSRWSALQADTGWEVRSPRGARCFTAPTPAAARQVARAMAGIDTLLARLNTGVTRPYGLHAMGGSR